MSHKCEVCNKYYSSYQSLWIHSKKYHGEGSDQNLNGNIGVDCSYCKKNFASRQSRWRHEKVCTIKNSEIEIYKKTMSELIKKQEEMTKQLDLLKSSPNKIINYNTTVNTLNNNTGNMKSFNLCNPGEENSNLLTLDEKKFILSQGMNSIISMVDILNFNERLPEHHNFYVSSINDKHVNTLDKSSNSIVKKSKKDLFDQVLFAHVNKLENINNSINYKEFDNVFNKLKAFIFLKKGKKEYFNQLNMLSYNKRHLIVKTWEKIINDDSIKAEDVHDTIENKIKEITNNEYIDDSDIDISDIESEEESESEEEIIIPTFKKGKSKSKKSLEV